MSDKNFLSWVGFKGEDEKTTTPTGNALERIRDLEAQLADLRSRRDITSLTKEEFEILATETAMTIIKSAQGRESKAAALAQKVLNESTKTAKENVETSEAKARQILAGAEARGRKYIEAAESEAAETKTKAERDAEELISSKKREAGQVTANAKREADKMIADATIEIANYRTWLTSAISESERLYRIQTQSLQSAEQAIAQSRAKLSGAFEKLSGLQIDVDANLTLNNHPQTKTFVRAADVAAATSVDSLVDSVVPEVPLNKAPAKRPARSSSRAGTKKPVKRTAAKRK